MSKTFTLCQIKHKNGKNGNPAWIVIRGVVYDVTTFIKQHPGGATPIMEYAGKDATNAFIQAGHSKEAVNDMKLYEIGTVATECTHHLKFKETINVSKDVITKSPKLTNFTQKATTDATKQCCNQPEEKTVRLFCCC